MSATTAARVRRREVGREREAGGLGGVHADADEKEGEPAPRADDGGAVGVARQDDQREGHDGEAAELEQRAEPDVGRPPPAEIGPVRVGPEADERPERREDERERHHQPDDPGRNRELDDHDAVEGAGEEHRRDPTVTWKSDSRIRRAKGVWRRRVGKGGLRPEPHQPSPPRSAARSCPDELHRLRGVEAPRDPRCARRASRRGRARRRSEAEGALGHRHDPRRAVGRGKNRPAKCMAASAACAGRKKTIEFRSAGERREGRDDGRRRSG